MYRAVDVKIWRKISSLTANEKYLYLYLHTCSNSHYCGVYYNPLDMIKHESGLGITSLKNAINKLVDEKMILYDSKTNEVYVPEMAKHNIRSPQQKKGAYKHITGFIESNKIKKRFAAEFPGILHEDDIDDNEEKEKQQIPAYQEEEEEEKKSSSKDEKFEKFWNAYCRPQYKGIKGKAKLMWRKLSDEEKESAINMIPQYAASHAKKSHMQHAQRYLRDKSWQGITSTRRCETDSNYTQNNKLEF